MASKKDVADQFGVPIAFIDRLIEDGVLERGRGRGGMRESDVKRAIGKRYHELYYQALADGRSPSGQADGDSDSYVFDDDDTNESAEYRKARTAKLQAEVRHLELKEAALRRESAPIYALEATLAKLGAVISGQMDQLVVRMKQRNPDLSARDLELVKNTLADTMNTIADLRLEDVEDLPK